MSPEFTGINPEWEFLKNSELYQLQQLLDTSITSYNGVEDLRNKCTEFRRALEAYFEQFFSEEIDETELRQTVEFLRRSFKTLDSGGLNVGRSQQDVDLNRINELLMTQIGEQKYFELVQQYEDKIYER
jgi:hypothetical protein